MADYHINMQVASLRNQVQVLHQDLRAQSSKAAEREVKCQKLMGHNKALFAKVKALERKVADQARELRERAMRVTLLETQLGDGSGSAATTEFGVLAQASETLASTRTPPARMSTKSRLTSGNRMRHSGEKKTPKSKEVFLQLLREGEQEQRETEHRRDLTEVLERLQISERDRTAARRQLAADAKIKRFLDIRLAKLTNEVEKLRKRCEDLTMQTEADAKMKEFLQEEWDKVRQENDGKDEAVRHAVTQAEDAVLQREADEQMKTFLTEQWEEAQREAKATQEKLAATKARVEKLQVKLAKAEHLNDFLATKATKGRPWELDDWLLEQGYRRPKLRAAGGNVGNGDGSGDSGGGDGGHGGDNDSGETPELVQKLGVGESCYE